MTLVKEKKSPVYKHVRPTIKLTNLNVAINNRFLNECGTEQEWYMTIQSEQFTTQSFIPSDNITPLLSRMSVELTRRHMLSIGKQDYSFG